ncbi:ATP-binding protein [Anaerobacillus isosaccharinicus]|uniref:histidine kinase n=1 Tax=Anaerobacillus isosaccharinicus TaxID=1532552 RepID=A0A1S2KYD0_9BACI|nr:ATP-binding protein [Anaerobacillus isosaccharinicus]MBA5584772.1 HAMP domain-containing protein [Anaerobacillus isosaccharinicus]QOY36863.1 HAMP domain-containing protein [Anaerobacillus isosaccharinicus]
MFRTFQSRLVFFFLLVSLSGIILVSLAIKYSFFGSFNDYLETKRSEQVEGVIERLELEYRTGGVLTGETMMPIFHHYAMVDNLFFKLYDDNDIPIIDTTRHLHMGNSHMMDLPSIEELESNQFLLMSDGKKIGVLDVYFPREYENIDSQFLEQFNKYIIVVALSMIFISIIVSFLFSKKLTHGLRQVSNATRELQKNNLEIRIPDEKHVEEINQLAKSFNELALSLSNQEKLRKQFTNDLAHELRTPLATLRSQIEAFIDGVWEPTPERLQQGHGELMRLVRLVDDLEQLLAAENPQIQLRLSEINGKDALESLRASFLPLFKEKKIKLLIEEPRSNFYFQADRDRFFQIMINLLNNALKYTNEGGIVTVTSKLENEDVCFIIEDNGQGISEEDLPHVFERFYRGEKSRNRKTGGVGIGLSIVKALVDAHKGRITIDSEQTIGTIVKVTFHKTNE